MGATASRGVRFGDTIPYQVPDSLDDLHGPSTGQVRVGPNIDTSLNPVWDLDVEGRRWGLYSAVVRDGIVDEQCAILNRRLLLELWTTLNLPARCRSVWERRFPDLAQERVQ